MFVSRVISKRVPIPFEAGSYSLRIHCEALIIIMSVFRPMTSLFWVSLLSPFKSLAILQLALSNVASLALTPISCMSFDTDLCHVLLGRLMGVTLHWLTS